MNKKLNTQKRKVYIIGSGIAALSAAVFLIRDNTIKGENIYIFEELNVLGGSCDGTGNPKSGYVIRGGRMFNLPTYECTWELLKDIPSLEDSNKSLMDEFIEFNNTFESYSKARLIDNNREKVNVSSMNLSNKDRLALLKLFMIPEKKLDNIRIDQWFKPNFFKSTFWYIWATTFAFQPWHSLAEMRRYMNRFIHEFHRLSTLEGISRTKYNQYDSLILPIVNYLKRNSVNFNMNCKVESFNFNTCNNEYTVKTLTFIRNKTKNTLTINDHDLVFVTNGSMTESSSLGSMKSPPVIKPKYNGAAWTLWENTAKKNSTFGKPLTFDNHVDKSLWESFTVTLKNPTFFKLMVDFTGNDPGTGGLVTFKDSNWLMSIVLPSQPHFINQPKNVQVFWGYGLFPNKKGNYVNKKMSLCSGEEILIELCNHLRFNKQLPLILRTSNCIPCMMPFITSQFMPRAKGDRPEIFPKGSKNLAFIGQFCEMPRDVVFTVEYSVRSAQTAVYSMLNLDKKIPPINDYRFNPKILLKALNTLLK